MHKSIFLLALLFLLSILGCNNAEPTTSAPTETITKKAPAPTDLYSQLTTLCGKSYPGKLTHNNANSDYYEGKPIAILLEFCNDKEISINLFVGEDGSMTWKIHKSDKEIRLKHQVIHEGEEADISQFGGSNSSSENPFLWTFPADEFTQKLIPVAKENVWTLEFDREKGVLVYTIFRGEVIRFRVEFDVG